MSSDIDSVKRDVAIANRILDEVGLATGIRASSGHASMRVPSDPSKFIVKGRGYKVDSLAKMRAEDMVICDLEGYKVDGPPGITQCREVKMHSCVYRARPDVQAIVHVHPPYTIVMSLLQATLVPVCNEGAFLVQDPLPVYPRWRTVWTEEDGAEVARVMGDSKAVILFGHGATTAGKSLGDAVTNMLSLEEQAKMNYLLYCAAGPKYPRIPQELVNEKGNRPHKLWELPHFKGVWPKGESLSGGVYDYYVDVVSKDL
jgi:ribulose-5-phosphate 4-epimerase/fuculose-1-phosphate aldolase